MSIFLLQTEPPGSLGSDVSPHVQSLIELRAMMAPRHSETASSSVIATKLVVCILVALLLKYLVYESSIYTLLNEIAIAIGREISAHAQLDILYIMYTQGSLVGLTR